MRQNLPVTNIETLLPENEFIYSRTDLKGQIVEANDAFARISGFQREEMIGQPHNIVRHPDMPEAAFVDMWSDLKAGRPWRGVVKNRRKDGGFYWVVANVSPVREDGRVVGYQSVRSCPTREEVASADAGYRRVRAGNSQLTVKHGRVIRKQPEWLKLISSLPFQLNFIALATIVGASLHLAEEYLPIGDARAILNGIHTAILLYGLFFLFFYAPRVNRELSGFADWLGRLLTTGNLRHRVDSEREDVVGAVIRRTAKFVSSVHATIQGMADVARQVKGATGEVGGGVHRIHDSASRQSQATSAAAAAVEEVTVSIGEVAEHARSTRDVANHTGEVSRDGVVRSAEATRAIVALSGTVASSAEQVESLGRRSDEISRVASVIKEIADQTNLLALNAAIEAARAGEAGRGFAVVADEVRKLAERTSTATQEISDTIRMIQGETRLAVEGMRAGAGQVQESVQFVQSAQQALQRIKDEMDDTIQRVNEISHASAEQKTAMTQLAQNVEQVAAMTEQNVSVVDQAEDMVESLRRNVERMEKSVNQFVL